MRYTLSLAALTLSMLTTTPAMAGLVGFGGFECGGDGPPCAPPPPPPRPALPPGVVSYGSGAALVSTGEPGISGQSFVIGAGAGNYVVGATTQSASSGTSASHLSGTGLAEGRTTLGPVASASAYANGSFGPNQTPVNPIANIFLLYKVTLHAQDASAASALFSALNVSGAIANVSGHTFLGQTAPGGGLSTSSGPGTAASFALVTTGVGIFENANPFAGTALYGKLGSDFRLLGHSQANCAHTNFGFGSPDTSGCGIHGFSVPVNFVSATNYVGGSALDFIGNVELRAFAAASDGSAYAFVDPQVTLSANLNPNLYSITLGNNGNVSNLLNPPGVPEPASWALMLTGFGLVGGAVRRRSRLQTVTA